MIFGSLSFSNNRNASSVVERFREVTDNEQLIFYPVIYMDFIGGYFLHPRLPYKYTDLYFFDATHDIIVLMSGSVYNRTEIYKLFNIDVQVPDPERISLLFMKEGPAFVEKLNGDFSIFLLIPGKREAYLFRDHVGIRPFAWMLDKQTLFFSSDINGLCRALSNGRAVDRDFLLGYFKYIDYRKTPDKRVKKILPGHFLHFSEAGTKINKYWYPKKIRVDKKLKYSQMLSDLKILLWDAVKIRCDNRFNAGTHVSSGIDSGIVAALARKEYPHQEKFYGFSWSPHDFNHVEVKYDERELVFKSCEKSDILPVFSNMNIDNFPAVISSFYCNPGVFYEYKTIEQALEFNTNLIFSGWGGDEFISTGDRGVEQDLLRTLQLRTFFRRNPLRPFRKFIKNQLYYVLYPALGILDKGTAGSFREEARYIKKPFKKSDRKAIRNFYFHSSRHQLHLRMLRFYHLQNRCESWAINGYRNGIEYRYPLLDKRIIEYMLRVPSELLCKTDHFRPLLREIGKGILPEEVRQNLSKTDPVSWAFTQELFRISALLFMKEIDKWKTNPDLHFIDFDLLTKDINKFDEQPDKVNTRALFRALVFIKAIHEFIVIYR